MKLFKNREGKLCWLVNCLSENNVGEETDHWSYLSLAAAEDKAEKRGEWFPMAPPPP